MDKSHCTDNSYGGDWLCAYGQYSFPFANGSNQFFVIGPDFAVWTRWRTSGYKYSGWTSLGGTVRDSYHSADFAMVTCKNFVSVAVVGTNNDWYIDSRNSNGTWTGWNLGHEIACEHPPPTRSGSLSEPQLRTPMARDPDRRST